MTSVESEDDVPLVQADDPSTGSATLNASLNRLLASAVGSVIAESITLPTDVVKTRSDHISLTQFNFSFNLRNLLVALNLIWIYVVKDCRFKTLLHPTAAECIAV